MRIDKTIRRKINNALHNIGRTLHDAIPFPAIEAAFIAHELILLDDDGTALRGVIFCGEDGRADFSVRGDRGEITNAALHMTWHKHDTGRYEIVAYFG